CVRSTRSSRSRSRWRAGRRRPSSSSCATGSSRCARCSPTGPSRAAGAGRPRPGCRPGHRPAVRPVVRPVVRPAVLPRPCWRRGCRSSTRCRSTAATGSCGGSRRRPGCPRGCRCSTCAGTSRRTRRGGPRRWWRS
ncbi:MAG: hypothetical protein AVDCRST_MAG41-732, partial [uncultured Corynebacteriales bacterium]